MNFNPAATVWLSAVFNRQVDKLNPRSHRHGIKQVFNIVIAQANTALADPQPNSEISIGAVNSVQLANINGVQPHRIFRPGRNKRR
ncbi:hypothetical protein D3C81_1940000 [compost metagenome]